MLAILLGHPPSGHLSLAVLGIQGFLVVLVSLLVQAELFRVQRWGQGDQVVLWVQDLHALLLTHV